MSWPSGSRTKMPDADVGVVEDLAAVLDERAQVAGMSSTLTEMCVSPGSFIARSRFAPRRRRRALSRREVQQLEDETRRAAGSTRSARAAASRPQQLRRTACREG